MTAQAIGSLFVALGLDTAAFQAGIKQAQGRIEGFANDLNKRLGKLGDLPGIRNLQTALATVGAGLGAAVGAAAGVAVVSLGGMSVSAMNAAKEIQNLSRLANATPEDFQRFAYGAEQYGISQEKASDILKDFNDKVGDFVSTGGGAMKDFFDVIGKKTGVTIEDFRKLSGPQGLQLYVNSLEKAGVNQQDFAFYMEAIASDSTALVPLLKNGGKAAQEYADRLDRMGAVMSNSTVASLAAMKSGMNDVGVVLVGLKNQLGAAFAPVIASLAGAFVDLLSRGSAVRGVIDGLTAAIAWFAEQVSAVVFVISSLLGWLWDGTKAFATWINDLTGIGDVISQVFSYSPLSLITGLVNLVKATGGWAEAFTLLGEVASGVWEGIVSSAQAIGPGLGAVWETIKAGFYRMISSLAAKWRDFLLMLSGSIAAVPGMETLSGSLMGFASRADAELAGFERSAKAATDAAASLQGQAASLAAQGFDKAKDALGRLKVTTVEAEGVLQGAAAPTGGLAAVGNGAGGAAKKLSAFEKVMKALREEAERLKVTMNASDLQAAILGQQQKAGVTADSAQGKQIAGMVTMIDGMKDLKSATEEWRDSIQSAFQEFILQGGSFKKVLSQIIGKLAEMMFTTGFKNLWAGIGGNGLVGGLLKGLGIPGFANGTQNFAGGIAQVNERGGEIMNLPRGTQIIPHDISKRMADGAAKAGGGVVKVIAQHDPGILVRVIDSRVNAAAPEIMAGAVDATYARAREVPIG